MKPGSDGELEDEELAGFGEEDRCFGGDHAHILVGFHDLLDTSERELVVFEIVHLLDVLALVGPERLEMLLLLLEKVVVSGTSGGGYGGTRRRRRDSGGGGRRLLIVVVVVVVVFH